MRADSPDDPIRLQEGFLSCRTCGIAVQRTSDVTSEIRLSARGRAVEGQAALTQAAANQKPIPLIFGLCGDHLRIAELASQLIPEPAHPVIVDRVAAALDALSFVAPATVEHMAYLDREGLDTLARRLTQLGASARWQARFVPVIIPRRTPTPVLRIGGRI